MAPKMIGDVFSRIADPGSKGDPGRHFNLEIISPQRSKFIHLHKNLESTLKHFIVLFLILLGIEF